MGLMDVFRAEHRHSDPQARIAAVRASSDEDLLWEVATSDELERVRAYAAAKLETPGLLASIAVNDVHAMVRGAVVGKLADQKVLHTIARDDVDPKVRTAAIARIDDQSTISDIARTDPDPAVRRSAARAVHDPACLATLVEHGVSAETLEVVVERALDAKLLVRAASFCEDAKLKELALQRAFEVANDDSQLRFEVLCDVAEDSVFDELLQDVKDPALLERLCQEAPLHKRAMAMTRLRHLREDLDLSEPLPTPEVHANPPSASRSLDSELESERNTMLREGRALIRFRVLEHANRHLSDALARFDGDLGVCALQACTWEAMDRHDEAATLRLDVAEQVMTRAPELAMELVESVLSRDADNERAWALRLDIASGVRGSVRPGDSDSDGLWLAMRGSLPDAPERTTG